MDFKYRLMRFMSGRYGADELFFICFAVSVIISVVNIFVRSVYLQLADYAVLFYALFRVFSCNTEKRRRENAWVLNIINSLKRKKNLREQRRRDKCHIYKKCPSCKAILKLPHRAGVHKTVCPKCGTEFTVKVKK